MRIRVALVLLAVVGGGVAVACSREAAGPDDGPWTTLVGDSSQTGAPPNGTTPTPPPPPPDTLKPLPPTPGQVRIYGRVIGGTFIQSVPPGADTVRMEWLVGATIRAESGQGGTVVAETKTGAAGNYVFQQLPSGTYTIRAIAPAGSGYGSESRTVVAHIGDVQVDFSLWRTP